jgi:RecA/RadA recombinase
MAAQIAGNAQKMGIDVVYFDSESALDGDFLTRCGCSLEDLHYIPAANVEMVLETMERLLEAENQWLFIWDSLAMTPCKSDIESDYNPQSTMAMKPRVLSKGFQKLTVPLARKDATVLVLNQLRTNIGARTPAEAMLNPYFTPGGKTVEYIYSLRIWLTARKAKASFLLDDKGYRIGTEVTAKIKKSRFGSEGRTCRFKILWGDLNSVGIQDRESWFEAIEISKHLSQSGAWFSLVLADGTEKKFQRKNWLEMLQDPIFEERVLQIMDEDVIMRFENRSGEASDYYVEEGPPVEN